MCLSWKVKFAAVAVLFFSTRMADATADIATRTRNGIWLISDSLGKHFGNPVERCKVVVTKGRFIFHAGSFRDLQDLEAQDRNLPLEPLATTAAKVTSAMLTHRGQFHLPPTEKRDLKDLDLVSTGIIQVRNGIFSAETISLGAYDDVPRTSIVKRSKPGKVFGFAEVIDKVNREPSAMAKITVDPESALNSVMDDEVSLRPDEVGPPYTILLLHKDGTVSDFSPKKICDIPSDAAHKD